MCSLFFKCFINNNTLAASHTNISFCCSFHSSWATSLTPCLCSFIPPQPLSLVLGLVCLCLGREGRWGCERERHGSWDKGSDKDLSQGRAQEALHHHWLPWKSDTSSFLPAILSKCPVLSFTCLRREAGGGGEWARLEFLFAHLSVCTCVFACYAACGKHPRDTATRARRHWPKHKRWISFVAEQHPHEWDVWFIDSDFSLRQQVFCISATGECIPEHWMAVCYLLLFSFSSDFKAMFTGSLGSSHIYVCAQTSADLPLCYLPACPVHWCFFLLSVMSCYWILICAVVLQFQPTTSAAVPHVIQMFSATVFCNKHRFCFFQKIMRLHFKMLYWSAFTYFATFTLIIQCSAVIHS